MAALDEIMLLVMDCGGWFTGIDANTIKKIDLVSPGSQDQGTEVAELLGRCAQDRLDRHRRALTIFEGNRERIVIVDRLVGIYNLANTRMESIPPILRNFGVPSWLVGMLWMEDEPVYLLDLFHAIPPSGAGKEE